MTQKEHETIEWAISRLSVDGGMTEREQKKTAERLTELIIEDQTQRAAARSAAVGENVMNRPHAAWRSIRRSHG